MEDLNNIPSTGTFGNSINQVNQNFGLVKGAIENVEGRTIRSKGLFPTQAALTAAYPSPKVGDYAYVGSGLPATIYDCVVEGTWHNTGQTGGSETIDLSNYFTKSETSASVANSLAQATARMGYGVATASGNNYSVTIENFTLPANGGVVRVKMPTAATGASTLNITGSGAKTLWYNGEAISSDNTWEAGEIISVFYDGTKYMAYNAQGGGNIQDEISKLFLNTIVGDTNIKLFLNSKARSGNLGFTDVLFGSETNGVWNDTNTRVLFLSQEVSNGDRIYIKTNTGYRFVITSYNVVVIGKDDITPSTFIQQYEQAWVTEDTYVVPSSNVKSVVIKVSKTNNAAIIPDDIPLMISKAEISNTESESTSQLSMVVLEPASDEQSGLMTPEKYSDLDSLVSKININLSNHILGTETAGIWENNKTRMLFYNIPVETGDSIYVKTNTGYNFVISAYNKIIEGQTDIIPANFVQQYESGWVTEDTYVVPIGVSSIIIKTAKSDNTSMAKVNPDTVINVATNNKNRIDGIEARMDSLEENADSINAQLYGNIKVKQLVLTNHIIGTETVGVFDYQKTRILFLAGAVNTGGVVYVKTNTGYRFVITGYNVLVDEKTDITATHFVNQYEPAWVTEDTYIVPPNVKSIVIKVSRGDNGDITGDDPDSMINTAIYTSPQGIVEQVYNLSREGNYVDYEGEKITLIKNNMLYRAFGNADDRYTEGRTTRAAEGMAVFGNYLFRFYINGLAKCFDISSGYPVLISSFQLGSHALNDNHCNCAQFANSVVSGNAFPYVYIANCVYPICYVEQITTSSSSLIQTITVNSSFSFVWCNVCAGDDGYLYSVGINCQANVNGTMKVIKHQLPSPSQGNVTLSDADAVDSFEIPYDGSVHGLQGMEVRNGKIFLPMNGTGNASNGIIRVIDIVSKSIQTDIPISFHPYECEDVSVYKNTMYIGYFGSTALYKLIF